MICSLNEVGSALRTAAVGAGLTIGLAEATAAAGVWLCTCGLDGVGAVLAAEERGGVEPQVDIDAERLTATIRHAGISDCGPSVFELLCVETIERVVVQAPDSPLLLVGFAGTAAQSSGGAFELIADTGAVVQVSARSWTGATDFVGVGRIDVVPIERQVAASIALPRGVAIDESAWARVLDLAKRTYVPATETSRLSGAGAGLTDND